MELKSQINAALKTAMKEKDAERLTTLRLINAAIKDREIAARSDGKEAQVEDAEILAILGKMVKQRQESAKAFDEGGRIELADKERAEIKIIEDYLPRQLSAEEVAKAVETAIAATEASSIRDMGKVMGELKGKYTGQMDFGSVGPIVKAKLG